MTNRETVSGVETQNMPVNSPDMGLPALTLVRMPNAVELRASGNWTVVHVDHLEKLVDATKAAAREEAVEVIDLKNVSALDTHGALLLVRLMRPSAGTDTRSHGVGLAAHIQPLFDEVLQSSSSPLPRTRPKSNTFVDYMEALGRAVAELWRDLFALSEMLGALCTAIVDTLLHPSRFRLTSAVHHLHQVGWQAKTSIDEATSPSGQVQTEKRTP